MACTSQCCWGRLPTTYKSISDLIYQHEVSYRHLHCLHEDRIAHSCIMDSVVNVSSEDTDTAGEIYQRKSGAVLIATNQLPPSAARTWDQQKEHIYSLMAETSSARHHYWRLLLMVIVGRCLHYMGRCHWCVTLEFWFLKGDYIFFSFFFYSYRPKVRGFTTESDLSDSVFIELVWINSDTCTHILGRRYWCGWWFLVHKSMWQN